MSALIKIRSKSLVSMQPSPLSGWTDVSEDEGYSSPYVKRRREESRKRKLIPTATVTDVPAAATTSSCRPSFPELLDASCLNELECGVSDNQLLCSDGNRDFIQEYFPKSVPDDVVQPRALTDTFPTRSKKLFDGAPTTSSACIFQNEQFTTSNSTLYDQDLERTFVEDLGKEYLLQWKRMGRCCSNGKQLTESRRQLPFTVVCKGRFLSPMPGSHGFGPGLRRLVEVTNNGYEPWMFGVW